VLSQRFGGVSGVTALETNKQSGDTHYEGTGTRPYYLVNRADQKNEGPFGEKNCTEIEK